MSDRIKEILDSFSLPRRAMLPAALLGGSALGALLSKEVKADQAFTGFAFNASNNGNAAQRTDPDRWADVTNVLDFGADPGGNSGTATATTTAINNAIAVAAAKGTTAQGTAKGGVVFFPPGAYVVNGSILGVSGGSVRLKGSGMWCTRLRGTVSGFIIDGGTGAGTGSGFTGIEDISVVNDQTSVGFDLTIGAIRIGIAGAATENVYLKNIQFGGWTGIITTYPSAQNSTTFETVLINCGSTGKGSSAWNVASTLPYVTGPIGFYVSACTMICCEAMAYAVGIWFSGVDTVALRCRTESCAIGVLTGITPRFDDVVAGASGSGSLVTITSTQPLAEFGWINNGQTQLITVQGVTPSGYNTTQVTGTRTGANTFTYVSAFTGAFVSGGTWSQLAGSTNADANVIMGHSTERCATGVFLSNFGTSSLQSSVVTGTVGPTLGVTSISWASTAGGTATVTTTQPIANFNSDGNGTPWTSGTQQIKIESANTFPGYNTAGFVTGTWTGANTFTYPVAVNPGGTQGAGVATWSFQCQYGLRMRNVGRCTIESVGIAVTPISGAGVDLTVVSGATAARPTLISLTAGTAGWIMPPSSIKACYQYLNCDQPGGSTLDVASNVSGMSFADLPGQGGVSLTPAVPGMEYDLVNANVNTWGTAVTGSGSPNAFVKVRRNLTAWTVVGI